MQCSPKHLSRMCFSLNGCLDLFRPRRYRCNRYESHLEPGSENATRCFVKNKKYWLSFIRMDCSLIRFLRNWKYSICLQSIGFGAVIISAQKENKNKQTITRTYHYGINGSVLVFMDFGGEVLSNIKLTPHSDWKFTYFGFHTGFHFSLLTLKYRMPAYKM